MKRSLLFFVLLGSVSSINIKDHIPDVITNRFRSSSDVSKLPYQCCGCLIESKKHSCALKIESSEKCKDICPTIFDRYQSPGKWDKQKKIMPNIMSLSGCSGNGVSLCDDNPIRKYKEKVDCMKLAPAKGLKKIIGEKLDELIENHIEKRLFFRFGCRGDPAVEELLNMELQKIKRTLEVIDLLKQTADNEEFLPKLLQNHESYSSNSGTTLRQKIKAAAHWICTTSTTLKSEKSKHHEDNKNMTPEDFCLTSVSRILEKYQNTFIEEVTLKDIIRVHNKYTSLDPINLRLYRRIAVERDVKYGTVEAGSFAQQYAINNVQPHWKPVEKAMYLLTSLIRAHGFVDGNGRAIRTLYALTLMNYDIPLYLPTFSLVEKYAMQ